MYLSLALPGSCSPLSPIYFLSFGHLSSLGFRRISFPHQNPSLSRNLCVSDQIPLPLPLFLSRNSNITFTLKKWFTSHLTLIPFLPFPGVRSPLFGDFPWPVLIPPHINLPQVYFPSQLVFPLLPLFPFYSHTVGFIQTQKVPLIHFQTPW